MFQPSAEEGTTCNDVLIKLKAGTIKSVNEIPRVNSKFIIELLVPQRDLFLFILVLHTMEVKQQFCLWESNLNLMNFR